MLTQQVNTHTHTHTLEKKQTVSDRMLQFINSIDQLLKGLSQKEFEAFVAGLVGKKLERDKRLEQEAGRHWEEISLGDFKYDRYVCVCVCVFVCMYVCRYVCRHVLA
jgi:secreted Zn-dependent insulinase-like peptidase